MKLKIVLWMLCAIAPIMATEDIFKKPVRTKRTIRFKEDIAQELLATLQVTTALLDVQGDLLSQLAGISQAKTVMQLQAQILRMVAFMQQEIYKRIQELAEGEKNAFLNKASSRELDAVLNHIKSYNGKSSEFLESLKIKSLELKKTKSAQEKSKKVIMLDGVERDLLKHIQDESNFFKTCMLPSVSATAAKSSEQASPKPVAKIPNQAK